MKSEPRPKVKVKLANEDELELVLCGGGQLIAHTPYDSDSNTHNHLTVNRVPVRVRVLFNNGANGWEVDRYPQGAPRDVSIKRGDFHKGDDRVSSATWDKTLALVDAAVKKFVSDNGPLLLVADRIALTEERLAKQAEIARKEAELVKLREELAKLQESERLAAVACVRAERRESRD